jgi:predicted nucleic acid-binding protein
MTVPITRQARWTLVDTSAYYALFDVSERTHAEARQIAARLIRERRARAIITQYQDKSFSYTDAASFAVMERLGISRVFTFDRNFAPYGLTPLTPE